MPSTSLLLQSIIDCLKQTGGKASNQQMLRWVIENMQLSEVQIGLIRAGKRTELEYRLAWARTAARKRLN